MKCRGVKSRRIEEHKKDEGSRVDESLRKQDEDAGTIFGKTRMQVQFSVGSAQERANSDK